MRIPLLSRIPVSAKELGLREGCIVNPFGTPEIARVIQTDAGAVYLYTDPESGKKERKIENDTRFFQMETGLDYLSFIMYHILSTEQFERIIGERRAHEFDILGARD